MNASTAIRPDRRHQWKRRADRRPDHAPTPPNQNEDQLRKITRPRGASGLIWSDVCQGAQGGSVLDHFWSGRGDQGAPARCAWRRPEPGSRLAVGHPDGLALMSVRTSSCSGVRERLIRPWGLAVGVQRVGERRVVEADMRGLVTAGPCVRLERAAGLRTSVAVMIDSRSGAAHSPGAGCSSRCGPGVLTPTVSFGVCRRRSKTEQFRR